MIRVNYCKTGDRHRLALSGHAGYDNTGHDIVCAGVSALSLALLAYVQTQAEIREAQYESGELLIDCVGGPRTEAAFDMAMTGFTNLANKFPRCVDVYIASDGG